MAFFFKKAPALENSGESVALRTMLSFTDMLPMRPILFRSSGMWETFSRMKPLGVNWATLEPFMSTRRPPASARR